MKPNCSTCFCFCLCVKKHLLTGCQLKIHKTFWRHWAFEANWWRHLSFSVTPLKSSFLIRRLLLSMCTSFIKLYLSYQRVKIASFYQVWLSRFLSNGRTPHTAKKSTWIPRLMPFKKYELPWYQGGFFFRLLNFYENPG